MLYFHIYIKTSLHSSAKEQKRTKKKKQQKKDNNLLNVVNSPKLILMGERNSSLNLDYSLSLSNSFYSPTLEFRVFGYY